VAKRRTRPRIPPSYVVDPDKLSPSIRGEVGGQLTLTLYLFNTGTVSDVGIELAAHGSAVEDRIIQLAEARLSLPGSNQPLRAAFTEHRREGLLVSEALLFEQPSDPRRPPPCCIPAGLELPPPFLCYRHERPEAELAWRKLELVLEVVLMPIHEGRGELEMFLAPLTNPVEGATTVRWEVTVISEADNPEKIRGEAP
jgi:hypothetical protein